MEIPTDVSSSNDPEIVPKSVEEQDMEVDSTSGTVAEDQEMA